MSPPIGGVRAGYISGQRDAIPDTSMLQSPIRQFFAGGSAAGDGETGVDFAEPLSGNPASAVNTPTFNSEFGSSGYATIDYNPANPDYHTWSGTDSLPTGSDATVSIIALYYSDTNSSNQAISGYGDFYLALRSDGRYGIDSSSDSNAATGSYPTGSLTSSMVTHDEQSNTSELFVEGSDTAGVTTSGSRSLSDTGNSHGYQLARSSNAMDGGIVEIIYSNVVESGSDYAEWHQNRLG